jgi:hypothetical protein
MTRSFKGADGRRIRVAVSGYDAVITAGKYAAELMVFIGMVIVCAFAGGFLT